MTQNFLNHAPLQPTNLNIQAKTNHNYPDVSLGSRYSRMNPKTNEEFSPFGQGSI